MSVLDTLPDTQSPKVGKTEKVVSKRKSPNQHRYKDVRSQEDLSILTSLFLVKLEIATGCAKHANVKAEVAAKKTEVATGCAKHANVKAEVVAKKTEVATGNVNKDHLFSEAHCLIFASDRTSSQPRKTLAIALGCYYLTNGYFYWIEKILVFAKMAIAWMIFQIVI